MKRVLGMILVVACLAGCATASPAPTVVARTVTVLPAYNRTGNRLVVQGGGLIERYIADASIVTVPDVLATEARMYLQERGFDVTSRVRTDAALNGRTPTSPETAASLASQSGLRGLVLYLEIRRWEPDAPMRAAFVIAGVSATLIDPATGTVVWTHNRPSRPVPTPGEIVVGSAYVTAARKLAREMLETLQPAPAASGG
jgi:hypothetical protein